jgi:hypothetical protein
MRRLACFLTVGIALMFSANALAQGDSSIYFVTYFSNNVSGAPDATVRIINDGYENDTLYPFFLVFDDSQELQACGYCEVSPDGLLSEDVKTELTNNPVTGRIPTRGVIKVFEFYQETGLHGWATHIERATPTSGAYVTSEAPLADANLTFDEWESDINLCYYAQQLGSGQGTITCTQEDHDF